MLISVAILIGEKVSQKRAAVSMLLPFYCRSLIIDKCKNVGKEVMYKVLIREI